MEFLFLLLPVLLLGGLVSGGGSDEDDDAPSPQAGEIALGTSENDILDGEDRNDLLLGGRGGDDISGAGGNDVLVGEFGSDTLSGGVGIDVLIGGDGRDALYGGTESDLLIGGDFSDELFGGGGDDVLIGGSGADTIAGEAGNDTLFGVDYEDIDTALADIAVDLTTTLRSGFGSSVSDQTLDRISVAVQSGNPFDSSPDELNGGDGQDFILGNDGDTLAGGAGADDFAVLREAGDRSVRIEDFDPATETLTVLVSNPATAVVLFQADGVLGTRLLVDGVESAYVVARSVSELTAGGSPWLFVEQA